jgi:transcriptional regulator with XRE-family HTH domain
MNVEISARLREERVRLGFDHEEMATAGEVGVSTYYNYDSGKRVPSTEYLAKIALKGVDVLYVLTGMRNPTALSKREEALLDNYRHADEYGRSIIDSTTSAVAQPAQKAANSGRE